MKRFMVAALLPLVFLVGCGAPAPEHDDSSDYAPVEIEPEVTETKVGSNVIVIDMDWDTIRVIRQRVHGVDCIITTNSDNIATTCDWSSEDVVE